MAFFDGLQGTTDLQRIQDLIERAFNKVEDTALLATNVVANVAIGTGNTPVFHGLARPIRGWVIVRTNTSAAIFEGSTPTDPSRFINLKASAGGSNIVTLLFF